MGSTHKHSSHTPRRKGARLVPVRALLQSASGIRFHLVEDSDETPIDESQEIFSGQKSEPARTLRAEIERVASRPYNILITGETGTGKTHAAREIHRRSARANKPFMELNCANLPDQLVEAELFGYCKGAFTGADRDRTGLFEEANGGVLFLDEIGDVPPTVQNRLLKAIDEKQIKRLGTNHYTFCDVQIIAATSRNLPAMIHNREFREDLYCRLAVLTVETTPLRDRREDIPAMIALFLREAAAIAGTDKQPWLYELEEDALSLLCAFDYPGNIRALRNLIFQLTSYVNENEPISIQLVKFVLAKLLSPGGNHIAGISDGQLPSSDPRSCVLSATKTQNADQVSLQSFLSSIARDGDIILPIELCVLRRDETFKQWTARAKRCSIEAARQTTGGSMRSVAERLGLTRESLWSHLLRARRDQNEPLFDWEPQSD